MDITVGYSPDKYNKVRRRTFLPKLQISRDSSMFFTKFSVAYHEKMECNNALNEDVDMDNDSPALSYETSQKKAIQVSKVADSYNNILNKHVSVDHNTMTLQHVSTEHPSLSSTHGDNVIINIQLPYDPNASTEPDLWNGNFHPISLHSFIEYIALDSKNIKDFLNFMARYIANKQVNLVKSNDLEDFKDIGEAIWNLISLVYQAKWDSLIANKNTNALRQKISAKFTSKIHF